tara:strand:- start:3832 stop:4545 length:714 start_codon:yes stop_codon:yes gene_type:complete
MRTIIKTKNGPRELIRANSTPPSTPEEATSRWGSFSKNKKQVTDFLNYTQFHLCAYSELRADLSDLGTHIEHIRPKSSYPHSTFDHKNLVVSSISHEKLATMKKADVFGGHAKKNKFDEKLFISCLDQTCPSYFTYIIDGTVEVSNKIAPNLQEKAQYTIDLLNLNSPYLVAKREIIINEIDTLIDDHLDNDQSLKELAAVELIPSGEKMNSFFSMIRQRLGNNSEKALAEYMPSIL